MISIDRADTAFLLICSALVMLMTPGLGLFYAGMVRGKNALSTFQQCFATLAVVAIQWIVIGYSLAFGPSVLGGLIGGLDHLLLNGVDLQPRDGQRVPQVQFVGFQMMFAALTPAVISGAFAERVRFRSCLIFALLWTTLVYDPVAHWVWGGGWIGGNRGDGGLGALDFAGGLVVHITSGVAGLACALVLGKRHGYDNDELLPHNLTMTATGTALLWFGWLGFNAGSALQANGVAALAFLNTNVAAAAAVVSWLITESLHRGKATVLGACTGAVAGLVAVTPAAGYIDPVGALLIGGAVSLVAYSAILVKIKLGVDDALDVLAVHGCGGAFGALAVGFLATTKFDLVAPNQAGLLITGATSQLLVQAASVLVAATYSFVMTFTLAKLVDWTIGLRVDDDAELVGLDLSQHGERGYLLNAGDLVSARLGRRIPRSD